MPIIKKPDYTIFASEAKNGELTAFPNLLRGWGVTIDQTAGKPPMEWFNALQKRTDEWLTYLSQRGLPEWQTTIDYPKDAVVQFAGKFYVAKKDNKGSQPDLSQNDWAILLGTAASRDVGTDLAGQVLTVGNYGLANAQSALNGTDLNTIQTFGFYVVQNPINGPEEHSTGILFLRVMTWQSGIGTAGYRVVQEVIGYGQSGAAGDRVWRRTWTGTVWSKWVEFYSQANKPPGLLINTQTFTTSGSYKPTVGAKSIRITLTGGGGGGGGCQASSNQETYFGAGGGAGATVISKFTLTGAANYSLSIGAGGAGGAAAANGSNGGTTTFSAALSAPGGEGGGKAGVSNTNGGSGGVATTGDIRINGGYGGDGQSGLITVTGQGGVSYFGGGGRAGVGGGVNGSAPGTGGGGAYDGGYSGIAMKGGNGAPGIIIIEEYS